MADDWRDQPELMKKDIAWILAVLITVATVVFQLMMGLTYPRTIDVKIGKQVIQIELRRSFTRKSDCPVILPVRDITVSGYILYKVYPSENAMQRIDFKREGDKLAAKLPWQAPSGKLEYNVVLEKEGKSMDITNGKPVVITFYGRVPLFILILQSVVIFLVVLYSSLTGLYAGFGIKPWKRMTFLVIVMLLATVFFLQPLMHKFSLNQWWTCIPDNRELGNNKFLLAVIVWLTAAYFNIRKTKPGLIILASFISALLFLVPHGFPGTEREPVAPEILIRNLLPLIQLF